MKMSAKPFKKARAHFLSDAHKVKRLNWCVDMKRKMGGGARRTNDMLQVDAQVFNENDPHDSLQLRVL